MNNIKSQDGKTHEVLMLKRKYVIWTFGMQTSGTHTVAVIYKVKLQLDMERNG